MASRVYGGLPDVPQLAITGKESSSSPSPQDEEWGIQGGREQPKMVALPELVESLGLERPKRGSNFPG